MEVYFRKVFAHPVLIESRLRSVQADLTSGDELFFGVGGWGRAVSESFWFIFSVNIGENLSGICRLLHVSALCVSGDVCIFEVKHTIPDRT